MTKHALLALAAAVLGGCASNGSGFYGHGMRLDRERCGVREYGWWDRSPRRCSWYNSYSDSLKVEPTRHSVDRPG